MSFKWTFHLISLYPNKTILSIVLADNIKMAGAELGKMACLYFIAKCKDIPSLKQCLATGQWACHHHQNPPNPPEVLTDAYLSGNPVVIIFSVNNCHGWHGYASMLNVPGSVHAESIGTQLVDSESSEQNETFQTFAITQNWQYFTVRWEKCFLSSFGEQCLSYRTTEHLTLSDGSLVNKSRNWQQLPETIGQNICQLIDGHFEMLIMKQQKKEERRLENQPKPFLSSTQAVSVGEDSWVRLLKKVETELGRVLLACPFGSQRSV